MSATLLTPAEWEDLLRGRPVPAAQTLALGTIIEVLEVAEATKKGRGQLDPPVFRQGWSELRTFGGALHDGRVFLASLDQDCLTDSLFEDVQGAVAVNLRPAVVGTAITPARSMHRLILRPSGAEWWGEDAYEEMEERLGEEPGRNG